MAAPLTIATVNTFLASSEARDKLGRLVQYGSKMAVGLLSENEGSKETIRKFNAIQSNLADARRANRWLKSLSPIQQLLTLAREAPHFMAVNAFSKLSLLLYLVLDHLRWLQKLKIVDGDQAGTGILSMKFFTLANLATCLYNIIKLQYFNGLARLEENKKKIADAKRAAFKALLLVIQGAHLSQVYKTHDAFVGFLGVVTSLMDCQAQWPKAGK